MLEPFYQVQSQYEDREKRFRLTDADNYSIAETKKPPVQHGGFFNYCDRNVGR